jgi:hypothetical protein
MVRLQMSSSDEEEIGRLGVNWVALGGRIRHVRSHVLVKYILD